MKQVLIGIIALVVVGLLVFVSKKTVPETSNVKEESQNLTEEVTNQDSNQIMDEQGEPQLIMKVLEEGTGEGIKDGQVAKMLYTGYLVDGTVFDTTDNRGGEPFSFTLGAGEVIQGWDIGVKDMKVGERRQLVIPPSYGYGDRAIGAIPANSTLIFEVVLVAIE